MDPAIIVFGFGVGFLVGLTGMGGGSLMTPLLILLFGIKPVTAIGTDIFYAAITKMVGVAPPEAEDGEARPRLLDGARQRPDGDRRRLVARHPQGQLGDQLDEDVFAILAAALLVVGVATLIRGFFLADKIEERDDFEMHRRHKVAAVAIGATTGFVIGISSAGRER